MSKLNIDQKDVKTLFSEKKSDFLIPDYQRPYAWEETECQTLWDDLFQFSFPEDDCNKFNTETDEYFLGPIVTFKNENGKMEVIDGQQRLTTLLLLLRAFYAKYGNMKDDKAIKTSKLIEQCIWKTDEFGNPDKNALKINSEVANDKEKDEFLRILKTGIAKDNEKSRYAVNYRFFQQKIIDFLNEYPDWFSFFPIRIMKNCILLPIEAESQDTALRIFSTLNDRGKPLSDADIFKAQFYKYFSDIGEKDKFIQEWKELESLCNSIFHPNTGTPMDELFTRYMYYERAKQGIKQNTTEALRKFYEKNNYELLKNKQTFKNLIDLASFWNDVQTQNIDCFSDKVLKRLFVLNNAPNSMWTYLVSAYYMTNKDEKGLLNDNEFYNFLFKITAFIWMYSITNPGVTSLRTPIYTEMVNVVNKKPVTFTGFFCKKEGLYDTLDKYLFPNNRVITKSMLTWWAFNNDGQKLLSLTTVFEIEHIYPRKRVEFDSSLNNPENIESIGNKSLLEKHINIRASDFRFHDKVKRYKGFENNRGQKKEGTGIKDLLDMSTKTIDFTEQDIIERKKRIISAFITFLDDNKLLV